MILLEQLQDEATAWQLAENIRQRLAEPFLINGQQLSINPSIGVAIYPQHGREQKELLLSADEAMYLAKKAGGNQVKLSDGLFLFNRSAN